MKRKILIYVLVLGVIVGGGYGYYRYKFPFGNTHRCSKILAGMLDQYAADHEGRYPQADDDKRLGLEMVIEEPRHQLAIVVGKAGDLEEAEKFYKKSGFLLKEHSSWHYVSGLTTADKGRALAWDKIPLTHNGMRISHNPREVIMVGGWLEHINESHWEDFLKQQEQIATEKKEANNNNDH